MSHQLRDAYRSISDDYLSKKNQPWADFQSFYTLLAPNNHGISLDVGAGNGRNLNLINASMHVAIDLSSELLRGYVGPPSGQCIAGALPKLPIRRDTADIILLIAVLHHFRDTQEVILSLNELNRISSHVRILISVWRKWRRELRKSILFAIKNGLSTKEIVNHERPWYNSEGSILANRFYHYYTFKELYFQLRSSGLHPKCIKYLGGKYKDANIFVEAIQSEKK